ncbi:hypothetical protein ABBQ38_009297 [Trebouxia sp. C0009 RCD-2024]
MVVKLCTDLQSSHFQVAAVPDDRTAVPEAASDVVDIRWVPITSLRLQKDLVVNAARIAEEAAERFEVHS